MNDRRTTERLVLDPLLAFPTSVDEISARLTGGAVIAAAAASHGVSLCFAVSACVYGYHHEGLRRMQAYSLPWLR